MDVPEYECNENINVKDDDSAVAEECWKETYRGDSRKWLMKDESRKNSGACLKSTMKATYSYPFCDKESNNIGERKLRIMQQLYEEATTEIIQEHNKPFPIEKYCTEYDGNYSNIKVTKCEHEEDTKKELYNRYPLYTSNAMSYWNFQIKKNRRKEISLSGLTPSVDLKNPFKRHSAFTKPISEALDDCSL